MKNKNQVYNREKSKKFPKREKRKIPLTNFQFNFFSFSKIEIIEIIRQLFRNISGLIGNVKKCYSKKEEKRKIINCVI